MLILVSMDAGHHCIQLDPGPSCKPFLLKRISYDDGIFPALHEKLPKFALRDWRTTPPPPEVRKWGQGPGASSLSRSLFFFSRGVW